VVEHRRIIWLVLGRRATIVLGVLLLVVLGFFLYAGALDPPSRLRTRPNTATPKASAAVAAAVHHAVHAD
jgi:hypothetical protein